MPVFYTNQTTEDPSNVTLVGGSATNTKRIDLYLDGEVVGYIENSMPEGGTPPLESSAASFSTGSTAFPAGYGTSWGGSTMSFTAAPSANAGSLRLNVIATTTAGGAHTPSYVGLKCFFYREAWIGWTLAFTGVGTGVVSSPTGTADTVLQALSSPTSVRLSKAGTSKTLILTPSSGLFTCAGDGGTDSDVFWVGFYRTGSVPVSPATLTYYVDIAGNGLSATSSNAKWEGTATLPAASSGPWSDLSSDATGIGTGSFRNLLRFFSPTGVKTERPTISNGKLYYQGHELRLFHLTFSNGTAANLSAADCQTIVEEIRSRGCNLVRLHHIDNFDSGGGLRDTGNHCYAIDPAQFVKLANMIDAIRNAGLWYTLDLNSLMGNSASHAITGSDAALIYASATSIQRFKQLPPVLAGADIILRAYASGLLATNTGKSWGTIGSDPHLLYVTITNEHFPAFTVSGDAGSAMNAAWVSDGGTGSWDYTNSSHRTWYTNKCIAYVDQIRTWLASVCGYTGFLAWGSEFGAEYTEYDELRNYVDIRCHHAYSSLGGAGAGVEMDSPLVTSVSVSNLFESTRPYPTFAGPHILEEYNCGYPNRWRSVAPIQAAVFARLNGWSGMGLFDYGDGSWVSGSVPDMRALQVSTDRIRDIAFQFAGAIYLRGDLYETSTPTNYALLASGMLVVDTEKTLVLAGRTGASYTFQRGQSITITGGPFATVAVSTLDNLPIWESKRLLVGHLTDIQERGAVWTSNRRTNMTSGGTTECVRHGTASLSLYSYWADKVTVNNLSLNGNRSGSTLSTSVAGNLVSFSPSIGETTFPLAYECQVVL